MKTFFGAVGVFCGVMLGVIVTFSVVLPIIKWGMRGGVERLLPTSEMSLTEVQAAIVSCKGRRITMDYDKADPTRVRAVTCMSRVASATVANECQRTFLETHDALDADAIEYCAANPGPYDPLHFTMHPTREEFYKDGTH